MADIRINDLPNEATPNPSDFVAIDGTATRKTSIQNVVDAGAPVASQAKAEAGVDNNDRMTALTTKQAIDFNSVPLSRTVTAGTGLTGGGSLASNISLALSSTSIASLALADSAVQPSRQVIAGTGLSGGGALSSDVTLNVSAATQTSLGLANTAIQDGSNALVPNGGNSGQVLIKNSNTNRDTTWATIAAATAVSYSAQSLTASQQAQARANISAVLARHYDGLFLSNNSTDPVNDIDISSGEAASTETNPVLMVLSTALTKRLDAAWAVGTGNGGRDTGAIADGTWHIWLIQRSDTGVVDALFSLSATTPTMPTSYDRKRRIGSILRSGGTILGFNQTALGFGRSYRLNTAIIDRNSTAAATNVLLTLSVPTGIRVFPYIDAAVSTNTSGTICVLNFGDGDQATANQRVAQADASSLGASNGGPALFCTNTSAQLRFTQNNAVGTPSAVTIRTNGWIDATI